MTLAKWQIKEMETLEGRDLMYFLLHCRNTNVIEGDALTQFLTENISDELGEDFIKEEADAE